MKLHNQFLRLHSRCNDNNVISITLGDIAKILDCTHRNAMMIINHMAELGWITWTSQRGRGRRSTLHFLVQPQEIAVQSMMEAINRKDIKRALDGISYHTQSSVLQEHLQGWLLTYFGQHSEIRRDRQIDTLRLPIREQIGTVDPLYMNLLAESFISSHVFDGLLRRSNGSDEEILPNIAHAWDVDQSRTVWTFFLRKEVLFHNGRIMTAEDVVYTFERLIHTSRRTLYSSIFRLIRSIRALTPTTVRIELKEPNELFLPFLCTSRAAIVPRDLEQLGEAGFGIKPVGTGPFKVTEMNESLCSLEVFAHYFRGRAHLDRVEIVHVPWDMMPGSSQAADSLSPFHLIHNSASAGDEWSHLHSDVSVRKFITCNTKKTGPLSDPAIRAHVLSCLRGEAAEQRQSLQGCALQIATIPQYRQDAEFAAEILMKQGCDCSVLAASPEEFKGAVRLESDLILFAFVRDRDEQLRLFDLYLTIAEHVEAHTRIDIETSLRSIARARDPQARAYGFKEIETRLLQEQQLFIMSERPVQTAYLPSVRGVTFNSQGWVDLRNVWFPPVSTLT
ncbi:SgrR family transcriptional regulator [Paenibacillus oenotherae]|uniref:SgrR family transcriptional regulator n=1 Tax=Paenibacillus oenotherae TaxID=1435645 RepID=A0ABS7DBM9_9BACL|nr:ABC transporter substrate-binding protein [Paenibacillus oenotherae]MBW7477295.1 SgrR family transcriptional regulator [Paenibacillus oenotherae]